MDALLVSFINSLAVVTLVEDNDIKVHVPVKRTNTILGMTVQIIVSQAEPSDLDRIPMNILWSCFDRSSSMYKKLYRRVSKSPDAVNGTTHTWELVSTFDHIWEEQFYADGDEPIFSNPVATTTTRGIMHINGDAEDPEFPVVVGSNDPRNTDSREPLPHESMHPNKPAAQLLSDHTTIDIVPTTPAKGSVLYGSSKTTAVFSKLGKSSICEKPPTDTPKDPSSLAEAPYTGMLVTGLTQVQKMNGVPEGTTLSLHVVVYGAGTGPKGFRKLLGSYTPSSIKHNGNTVSSVILEEGNNDLEVAITASGFPSLVLHERIVGKGV